VISLSSGISGDQGGELQQVPRLHHYGAYIKNTFTAKDARDAKENSK
jgi:hypothetical protein